MLRRILVIIAGLGLCFGLAPSVALAGQGADALSAQGLTTQSIASGTWGTCPWVIDDAGTLTVNPGVGEPAAYTTSPWWEQSDRITKVVFATGTDGSKVVLPENSSYLFADLEEMTSADLRGLDASKTTSLYKAFFNCYELENVDVRGLDTSSVANISNLFYQCSKLATVEGLEDLNLSKVTDLSLAFYFCESLQGIDLSCLAGAHLENGWSAFSQCKSVTAIYLSGIDTSQMTNAQYMFNSCTSLATIYVDDGWSTASLSNSGDMFFNCTSLLGGAGTPFSDSHTNKEYARVDGGPTSDTPGYLTYMQAPASIEGAVVTLSQTSFPYNGSVQKPTVTSVVLNSGTSIASTDYAASYSNENSKDPGSYTVTVTGKNNYRGTASATYSITGSIPTPTKVAVPTGKTLIYNGKKQTGVAAVEGYELSGAAEATDAGSYTATAALEDGYVWADGSTGSKVISWKINKAKSKATTSLKKTYKAKVLKKKAQVFAPVKLATDGKVVYSVAKRDSKKVLSFNKKTGKVTVKKGAKKGKYVIKVKVSAKVGKNYSAFVAKTYSVRVTVK